MRFKINISKKGLEPCWRELKSDGDSFVSCQDVVCTRNDRCKNCIFGNLPYRNFEDIYMKRLMESGVIKPDETDKSITLQYLEGILDKMYEIEDMNYVLDCWSSRLSKDIETIEKAIEVIKEWDE